MEQSPAWESNKSSASQKNISLIFLEPDRSLPYSQELAICPYPEPDRSSFCPSIQPLEDPF
jgi:hypothetical protein